MIEVCANGLQSAIHAQKAGANRIFTSGQKNKAPEGIYLIMFLNKIR